MENQLVLRDRKILCGRFCVLEGLARHSTSLHATDLAKPLNHVGASLLGHAEELGSKTGRLDHAVQGLESRIQPSIENAPGIEGHEPKFDRLLTAIRGNISAVSELAELLTSNAAVSSWIIVGSV